MATSDTLGLFMSPEQYQAQQLAQQQAAEQQRAINFAGLDPRQQAVYGMFLGGQQLARGLGGLLGVQDPQLQRIRQRQEIMQSINPADANSLMAGIQRASQAGDNELALSLTDFMREQESKIQLGRQRQAAAEKERTQALPAKLQGAARIAEIERTLVGLPKESTEYIALTAEKTELQKSAKTANPTEKQREAEAYADTVSEDRDSKTWKEAYKTRLDRLQLGKEGEEKLSPEAILLRDAGYIPGSPMFISKIDELVEGKKPSAKSNAPSVSAALNEIALTEFDKPFIDLTKEDRAKVRKLQKDEALDVVSIGQTGVNTSGVPQGLEVFYDRGTQEMYYLKDGKRVPYYESTMPKAAKVEVKTDARVMPGEKGGAKDITEYEASIQRTVEKQMNTVNSVESALSNLNLAQVGNNASAFNAARVQLAKALGDSTLSRADIENAGGDPAVVSRIIDITSTIIRGRPGDPTVEDIRRTLTALAKVASKQANATLDRQRNLAMRAKDKNGQRIYSDDDIKLLFDFPQFTKFGGAKPEGKPDARDASTLPRGK